MMAIHSTSRRSRAEYLDLRQRYEPESTRLVIIAESPPASGRYFYDPAGAPSEPLFAALMRQLRFISAHQGRRPGRMKEASPALTVPTRWMSRSGSPTSVQSIAAEILAQARAAYPQCRGSHADSLRGQNSADSRKSVRAFKGIICGDISEFEFVCSGLSACLRTLWRSSH
jgi:hypothetical protein